MSSIPLAIQTLSPSGLMQNVGQQQNYSSGQPDPSLLLQFLMRALSGQSIAGGAPTNLGAMMGSGLNRTSNTSNPFTIPYRVQPDDPTTIGGLMSGAGATQGGSVQRSTIPKVEIGEAPPPTGPYWQRMPNNHKMDPSSTYMSYGLAADDKDPTHDNLYKYIQPESVNSTISYDMK